MEVYEVGVAGIVVFSSFGVMWGGEGGDGCGLVVMAMWLKQGGSSSKWDGSSAGGVGPFWNLVPSYYPVVTGGSYLHNYIDQLLL